MLCTIVTDASFCPDTNVGAWAAWIVCNDIRVKKFGVFKWNCKSSTDAEFKAAMNGAFIASERFEGISRYHFVLDNKTVIDEFVKEDSSWKIRLNEIVGKSKVTAKHVRAHENTKTARSWVNNWCDINARREMRKARDSKLTINLNWKRPR